MITKVLDAFVVLSAGALLLIAAIGGIDFDLGLVRLRLHDWTRPLAVLLLAMAARAWASRAPRAPLAPTAPFAPVSSYLATRGMLALLIAIGGVYAHHHIRVAGGLDSYGYVSASHLLASGRLSEPQPLAAVLPFDDPMNAAAPLGHVPSADGARSVPRFPLGLPIVMALFTIFGSTGPFYVPLMMAYASIALAYLLGREPTSGTAPDHVSGLLTAVLVAADPLFAAYAIQPMSDVPATCWLLAAIWLHTQKRGQTPFCRCVRGDGDTHPPCPSSGGRRARAVHDAGKTIQCSFCGRRGWVRCDSAWAQHGALRQCGCIRLWIDVAHV